MHDHTGADVTAVVRESGERTASACAELLGQLLPDARIERVHAPSFNEALARSLRVGLQGARKWTLCIDADVLPFPSLHELIAEAERLKSAPFLVLGLVRDKLLLSDRPAGNHLYATRWIPAALPFIPASHSLRPEADMIQAMRVKGFAFHQSRSVIGAHDFEQSHADIYSKAFLHGHKHRHLASLFRPAWEILSRSDPDFATALTGLQASLESAPPSLIARHQPLAFSISDEKPPLEVQQAALVAASLAEHYRVPEEVEPLRVALQNVIDTAVFPEPQARRPARTFVSGLITWSRVFRAAPRRKTTGSSNLPLEASGRPRRLLLAIDSLTGGGAERVITRVANRLSERGEQVQVVLTLASTCIQPLSAAVDLIKLPELIPPSRYFEQNADWKIAAATRIEEVVGFLGTSPSARRRQYPNLAGEIHAFRNMSAALGRHVLAWRPDCILSFLPNTNLMTLMARAYYAFDVPVLCSDRSHISSELARLPWPRYRSFLMRRHYPAAERHVVLTPVSGQNLIDRIGVVAESIVVIPNGVRPEELVRSSQEPIDVPAAMSEPGVLRIAAVGRLSREKGFDLLIQALSQLRALRWQLLLIGEGDDRASLENLARELGVEEQVLFLGWQPNPHAWMGRCDLFVLSSRWEGMPNALLEAMALGLPIVATDCLTGPAEILDGGRYGVLVPNGSIEGIRKGVEDLADPGVRRLYAERSRLRAQAFDEDVTLQRFEQLFDELAPPRLR
ncbi:MAG TPA: glycosyltransferase [Thermoanaerobaculia bacterium]